MHDTTIQGFQLSPQQRHLWALLHEAPEISTAQLALSFSGPLDLDRLRAAAQQVVERYEILRTTFRLLPGMSTPLQVIESTLIAWEPSVDQRELAEEARAAACDDLFEQQYRLPIDREHGPLVHALMVQLADNHHMLLMRMPALCADRRTLENIAAQLCTA